MASPPRQGLPSFFATSICKLLVGEQPCHLEPWLKGHLNLIKRPREDTSSLVKWKAEHTEMLRAEVQRLKAEGWSCGVERWFRINGQTAILSGKPDIIAQKTGVRPKIVDLKSGQPRETDVAQVLLYILALPIAWESPAMQFDGEVVYPTHRVMVPCADAQLVKGRLFGLLRDLAKAERPAASPSEAACRFCEATEADCPDRWSAKDQKASEVATQEW